MSKRRSVPEQDAGLLADIDDAEQAGGRHGIQSVEIAGAVLQALERARGPMTLTQLGVATGMGTSKVHRYLVSLCRIGLVSQPRSAGLYDMGPNLRRLGIEALRRTNEVGIASDHVAELRDRTGHAINLAVWGDNGPIIVRWEYGVFALPITVRIGATLPIMSSSIGQVFLTYLSTSLTEPLVRSELERLGKSDDPASVISRTIKKVKRTGVAATSGALIPGLASIAAPIFNAGQGLPQVLAITLPVEEAGSDNVKKLTTELLKAAAAISLDLGAASYLGVPPA